MRRWTLLLPLLVACQAPEIDTFTQIEVFAEEGPEATHEHYIDAIGKAQDTLRIALPSGEDPALSSAIIDAWDSGVEVEVITDIDLAESPAIAALLEAGVPTSLNDGSLTYFEFNVGDNVSWSSTQTIMSHAFVVADRDHIVASNSVGTTGSGTRVVIEAQGEDLVDDLIAEHNQVFGGTDATALTAYSGMAKSVTDSRWNYHTSTDVDLELWIGPQERLTKRVIDAVYGARSSVWIITGEFANEGLAHALQDKAEWGFDVQLVLGPNFGQSTGLNPLYRVLTGETPDVVKTQIKTGVEEVPTLILIDYEPDATGHQPRSKAMVLTHNLYSAARLYRISPVTTDQLIDGAMWVLSDGNQPSPEMVTLRDLFEEHRDLSEAL